MNNSTVKSKIESMVKLECEFKFIFLDGFGDCPDTFKIKFEGEVYEDSYECNINITLNFSSRMWEVDVNGFNTLDAIDREDILEYAIRQQMKFARTPCAEQKYQKTQGSDEDFYS